MKLRKFFIIFFIFALSFVACEKSTLKITQPEDSFFLNKLKDLGDNFKVSNGGGTITITNSNGAGTNYNFEKTISGLGGIYKDTNNGNYMVVVPAGNSAHTVTMKEEDKKTLEEIIDIIVVENSGGIIGALTTTEGFKDNKNIEGLKSGLSEEKQNQLQNLIDNKILNKTEQNLGEYKKFPEKTT